MSEELKMDELYHHGILGMKWGVKRTPEQLGHRPSNKAPDPTKARIKSIRDTAKAKAKRIAVEGKRQAKIDKAQDKANEKIAKAESKYKTKSNDKEESKSKSIKDMTDQEIRDKINRIRLEKELKSLQPEQVSAGKRFVKSLGNDVLGPAARDAGKRVLTDFFDKKGHELLGIDKKEAKDAASELKKQVEILNNKKKLNELNKYFDNEKKKEADAKKAAEDKKAADAKKAAEDKKAAKEAKDAEDFKKWEAKQQQKKQNAEEREQKKEERTQQKQAKDDKKFEEWWDKNHVYEGEVVGEGTSKRSSNSNNFSKSYSFEVDPSTTPANSTALLPYRSAGQSYIAGLLEKKD